MKTNIKKYSIYAIVFLIAITLITISFVSRTTNPVESYEEFYNMYSSCKTIDQNISLYETLPTDSKMFSSFSKEERISAMKTQLRKIVEDYNSKSKMITKGSWKSSELPYELNENNFQNLR